MIKLANPIRFARRAALDEVHKVLPSHLIKKVTGLTGDEVEEEAEDGVKEEQEEKRGLRKKFFGF